MIYQPNPDNQQAGISLMLAVLILASITAIALSLATIVLIEARSSADLKRTEPNLYATLGVTEMALFKYKRDVADDLLNIVQCGKVANSSICPTVSNVELAVNSTTSYDMPRILVIPAAATINIPLYFQANKWETLFGKIDLVSLSSNSGVINYRYNEIKEFDMTDQLLSSDFSNLSVGATASKSNFISTSQYELEIKNPLAVPVTVVIYSYNKNAQSLGLPYLGNKVFEVVAKAFGLTRVYRVQIPIP